MELFTDSKPRKSGSRRGNEKNREPSTWQNGLRAGFRAAIASLLSVLAAEALRLPYPFYSMVAAVIVTELSPMETQKLGLRRLAGTVIGALFGVVASVTFGDNAWTVGLTVLGAILVCYLSRLKDAAKIAAVVSGIVILGHGDSPWLYAFHRFIETSLGIVIAVVLSWVLTKVIPLFPAGFRQWLGETS